MCNNCLHRDGTYCTNEKRRKASIIYKRRAKMPLPADGTCRQYKETVYPCSRCDNTGDVMCDDCIESLEGVYVEISRRIESDGLQILNKRQVQ